VEVWQNEALVGGLCGVAMGRVFFGESMFSRVNDASMAALVHLVNMLDAWGYRLIDCQVYSEQLTSLGAELISRRRFSRLLEHTSDGHESDVHRRFYGQPSLIEPNKYGKC
jgi:leucyl/phenylalanyl-tRNA--protein transferase